MPIFATVGSNATSISQEGEEQKALVLASRLGFRDNTAKSRGCSLLALPRFHRQDADVMLGLVFWLLNVSGGV